MAYTAIDDPEAYFQVKLYSGTSSSQAITFDGDTDMQPDFFWFKNRGGNYHVLGDSVRGITKFLYSNDSSAEVTNTTVVSSLDTDGYTLGDNSNASERVNTSGDSMVSWNWKAGTTSGISGSPSITPSGYSFNQTSGFSIITYEGDGNDGDTIPHGLGVKPDVVFFKKTDGATNWVVQSNLLGDRVQLVLNDTDAENTDARLGASDDWDTTTVELGTYGDLNNDGDDFVAYCWSSIQGFSKFGLYTGNGDADDGPFVYCGFRPAWLIVKRTDSADQWMIVDNKRDTYNEMSNVLRGDATNAEESTPNSYAFDFLSNGFRLKDDDGKINASGGSYIYMAFAEAPFVNSNGVPCNAR